jgi:purine-nucleoside phosphorylase
METCVIEAAAEEIRARCTDVPPLAVTLGSGLGDLVAEVEVEWSLPYAALPGGPRTTALGHAGRLTCGRLAGKRMLLLEGRIHLYEGASAAETTRLVRLLHRLGVNTLVLTSAAGGLHPDYAVGDLVVLDDCLDFTHARLRSGGAAAAVGRIGSIGRGLFDPALSDVALEAARRANIPVHRGVYAAVTGPNYETRAEWRAYRRLGADVIGMSTAGEAAVAAQLGMRVLGLSTVTNRCRPDAPEVTDGAQVVAAARTAALRVRTLLCGVAAVVRKESSR